MDRATDSGPTASCSTPQEFVDDLMLEECFRSETGEELDSVNEKETEKVEVDEKGNMTDCKRSEESVEGTVEKEIDPFCGVPPPRAPHSSTSLSLGISSVSQLIRLKARLIIHRSFAPFILV
ncbi:unnamed protein product [Leuciscus chuanchicus]